MTDTLIGSGSADAGSSSQLAEHTRRATAWAKRAAEAGWLAETARASVAEISAATSADLFASDANEPLVVALFGGTGVGKSSVLNRLVGEDVAKVGVIRPTSLEATVYVHEDIQFAGPERAGFARATHTDDQRRHLVWVDMPDVDSTAADNRELVLGFLPFVDVLIYVVSPERYRDEAPWALLRERADQCAWVFVMNQIDRGAPSQLVDLKRAVSAAGFADPALFATSCQPNQARAVAGDQFAELADFIDSLAAAHIREALQEEGRVARLGLITRQLQTLSTDWPELDERDQSLERLWRTRSKRLASELHDDLVERLAPVAARMASGEAAAPGELWDNWASDRVTDALTGLQVDAREQGWQGNSLTQLPKVQDEHLAARADQALRESVRASLARPGNTLQRGLYSACGWLLYALPLLAALWTGWFVLRGFYAGATGSGDFVANGFAMNAVLLIGVAAGLPWLLRKLVEPSPRKAAMLGIRRGLDAVLDDIEQRAKVQVELCTQVLRELVAERDTIVAGSLTSAQHHDQEETPGTQLTARLRKR